MAQLYEEAPDATAATRPERRRRRRSRSRTPEHEHLEIMPSDLASEVWGILSDAHGVRELPAQKMRREIGPRVLGLLKADARDARAILSALCRQAPSRSAVGIAEGEVFLARAWGHMQTLDVRSPQRAAILLGHFLRGVPEEPVREIFRGVVSEWAKGRTAVESLQSELVDGSQGLMLRTFPDEERRHQSERRRSPRRNSKAAHALAGDECLESAVQAESVWESLSDAPTHLRLEFLDKLLNKGWLYAVSVREVVDVCARAAVAARKPGADDADLLKAQAVRLLGGITVESDRCAAVPDAGELEPATCLALVHVAGSHVGAWALPLLESLVHSMQEEPVEFEEADFFAVAGALAAACPKGMSKSFGRLAEALMARWSTCDLQELFQAMLVLPEALTKSPRALKSALARHCEADNTVLLALGQNDLAHIIDAWVQVGYNLPAALRVLLHCTVEHHLMALDARRLVGASALLDDGNPYAELAIVEWWSMWLDRLLEYRALSGWGRCSEALREVARWRDSAVAAGHSQQLLAESVLQGVVVEKLVEVADSAPLEMGLELSRAVDPYGEAAPLLEQKLEERVRSCLRGEGGGLPLVMAVAIANGETPVKCTPESKMWDALLWSVADQLKTPREVDLFRRCLPCTELKDALIARFNGDWRALELQMR